MDNVPSLIRPLHYLSSDMLSLGCDKSNTYCIREEMFRYLFNIRLDASDTDSMTVLETKIQAKLPLATNSTSEVLNGSGRVFCLGPDEWLLEVERYCTEDLAPLLDCHSNKGISFINISHSQVTFSISGLRSVTILQKGSTLDFHPRSFPESTCAQTALGQASVLIYRSLFDSSNSSKWSVYVDRSFAEYLWFWLEGAVKEFI
tara:strand:- start:42972 stop:43580 length:609 start_codon:yes stop_codon:yes gene_type:complete